jgi:RimJ/RimL family protein N-acetyltransferase
LKIYYREFHGPTDWGWVLEQVSILQCEDTRGIMAIDEDTNTTLGAVIVDNILPNSAQVHGMVADPALYNLGFMDEVCDYVFNVVGVNVAFGMCIASNKKGIKATERLGFKECARMKDAYAEGIDYVVMELKRADCKHLLTERAA